MREKLAIFDLDNTLIAGDSDHLWGEFLVEQGFVDGDYYRQENDRYYREYLEGTLDIMAFLSFSLRPLSEIGQEQLFSLRARFIQDCIEPIMLPAAGTLIARHRKMGDLPMIVTATNSFVTRPIADLLGIEHLIATEPECINDRFTGRVSGQPCFREGKVSRLNAWLEERDVDLAQSSFYTDSHNDLPLLHLVGNPIAVDPDDTLRCHALEAGWPVISLRA